MGSEKSNSSKYGVLLESKRGVRRIVVRTRPYWQKRQRKREALEIQGSTSGQITKLMGQAWRC